MPRRTTLIIPDITDKQIDSLRDYLGTSSATQVITRSVSVLAALADMDPERKGIQVVGDDGVIRRVIIL